MGSAPVSERYRQAFNKDLGNVCIKHPGDRKSCSIEDKDSQASVNIFLGDRHSHPVRLGQFNYSHFTLEEAGAGTGHVTRK